MRHRPFLLSLDTSRLNSVMPQSRSWIAAIVGGALFMQMLDATIIANALPAMSRSLHEEALTLNLAISTYFLSTAVFLPVSGWLADKFGARTVLASAIALFAASSALCGWAATLPQLIAGRALQGMAGAAMAPVGRLVLLKSVPKAQLVRALATLTIPALLGPILGPVVGGAIVTFASWPWIFFINAPLGVVGVTLVWLFVPNIKEPQVAGLDVRGAILMGLGLAGLIFGLDNVGGGALPGRWLWLLLGGGLSCLALYALHARRRHDAIVDLSLFKLPTFSAAWIGGMFGRLVLGASPFLSAMLLQVVFGLNAFHAGLLTFTGAVGAIFMKTAAPPIIRRFGFRRVLIVNTILSSTILMAYILITARTPHALIVALFFTAGFLRSLQFTALGAMAFADVPQARMSGASSLSSVGQQLSQALGVAFAALALHAMRLLHADAALAAQDVGTAFVAIGLLSLCAVAFFAPLAKDAAAELSGHR